MIKEQWDISYWANRSSRLLIGVLIIVLGLSLLVWGNPEIERWRVLFFLRIVEVLTVLAGVKVLLTSKNVSINSGLLVLLLSVLSSALLSVVLSSDTSQSIWGNYFRRDGVITLIHCILFGLVVAVQWEAALKELISQALFFTSCFVSIAVLVWHSMYGFSQVYAPEWQLFLIHWQLPNENMIAGFLLVTFPWYLMSVLKRFAHKSTIFLLSSIPIGAIMATQSWGAITTLVVGLALYLFQRKKVLNKVAGSLLLVMAIVIIGIIWNTFARNIVEGRSLIFRSLFVAIADKPWLGWGWSRVDAAFESGYSELFGFFPEIYVDKAHSQWLEYIITTGIVGFVAYIALQISLIKNLFSLHGQRVSSNESVMLWMLILYSIHSQTNVISIAEEVIFWFILGFCLRKIPLQA